ncbi:MAG: GntR family transcriptional regulator [Acidobacteriota bacterium]|nr:MAG: GntR family transcriptional regulator [Acidobacteriota bacterium]
MIRFNLDKNVKLSFYEQIKGQLLSAIYCGKIREGDRLPSIRELSDDLGINYKTIRRIYLRLAEEDYLELVRGSGAFLKKRVGHDTYDQMRRRAIFRLMDEVSDKAKGLGLSTEKFARLYTNYAQGSNLRELHLAVVDHEEEAFIFSRELRMRLGADVFSVSLGEVGPDEVERLSNADYLMTTSWHMEEVRELAQNLGKEVIEIKPSHDIYREILDAARTLNIAIVIKDERTLHASWDIFMNIYHPSTTKKFWIASIDREDLIDRIVEEADLIFVSPMVWDEMRRRTPAEKELKTYENFISETTVKYLKELQLLG